MSFLRYLLSEVSRGYLPEEDRLLQEKQRRVSTFIHTPLQLEKLMIFGFFICADSFLFVFTILPIRVLLALVRCCARVVTCSGLLLTGAEVIDIMRASILGVSVVAMSYVDTSAVYHIVRGQSVIKLYVIYNMLEIFDRLLASIGQDTLDTLFLVAAEGRRRKRHLLQTLLFFAIATTYVFIHTVVVLFQAVALNVAVNSYSKALLTILVSNNFVELKGSVFKKFETNNLFQMTCSDIRERFQYVILLLVVCVRNMAQYQWDLGYLESVLPIVAIVMLSEVFVDWVKHAFITKFNDILPEVYSKYRAILARDLATSRHNNAISEHSDLVSRRMGFIPLPLGCLVWKTLSQSLSLPRVTGTILVGVVYLCLLAFKILLAIILLGLSCGYRHDDSSDKDRNIDVIGETSHMTATEKGAGPLHQRKPTNRDSKPLSEIERYTLCSNRIV